MIYTIPDTASPLDQGDLLVDCPIANVTDFSSSHPEHAQMKLDLHRVIVLTQTCDIANSKIDRFAVACVFEAQTLIDSKVVKAIDVKGPIRAGRVWGLYFLPAFAEAGLGEMIVDLHRLNTIRFQLLDDLRRATKRRARLLTPYREHLAKHFGDTYSRIGLPKPYETT
ncbi:MAG: hypothetical protein HYR84_10610 [Planctomycetes bacterium]|nr:hypothetical protein [Planctomycetota bacterium]